jgi:hypothetical protein
MNLQEDLENERAERLAIRIGECHRLLANIYENLVDREFESVTKDSKNIITQIRLILKSMEEDDF